MRLLCHTRRQGAAGNPRNDEAQIVIIIAFMYYVVRKVFSWGTFHLSQNGDFGLARARLSLTTIRFFPSIPDGILPEASSSSLQVFPSLLPSAASKSKSTMKEGGRTLWFLGRAGRGRE